MSGQARRRRQPVAAAPRAPRSDFSARVLVAIPAIAFALFIVLVGGEVFAVALVALGLVCLHELYGMFERLAPVRLGGMLALAAVILCAQYGTQFQVLLAAMAAIPACFAVSQMQPRSSTAGLAVTLLGVWWIGLALAHAVLLRQLPHGDGILIDVLAGTFLGDTGAYLGGRYFGHTPLAPRLSPNKTLEGLVIGMVCAVVAVWFSSVYESWLPAGNALLLGLGVALAAPVGDLFESAIKRDAQTKDTGRLFGAHGGALDRLDAVFFSAVTAYYIWFSLA